MRKLYKITIETDADNFYRLKPEKFGIENYEFVEELPN